MKQSDIKRSLFESLTPFLKETKFKSRKKHWSFYRSFDGGCHEIVFPVRDLNPDFYLTCCLSTRIDAVEDLFHPFGEWDESDFADSRTLVVSWGELMGQDRFLEQHIETPMDVEDFSKSVMSFLEEKGFQFLKRGSDIGDASRLQKLASYLPPGPEGIFKSIILTALSGNELTDDFVEVKRQEAANIHKSYAQTLDQLVAKLRFQSL